MRFLIDTNVPLAANNQASVGPACVLAAIARLRRLMADEILVLDDTALILSEYKRHLSPSGQPGVGDQFYRWVYEEATYNPQHCEQVTLTLNEDKEFTAFPSASELAKFDPSDRKFVAAALTHPARPPIVNACDSDWHDHREALDAHGVTIEFICPEEMTRPRRP